MCVGNLFTENLYLSSHPVLPAIKQRGIHPDPMTDNHLADPWAGRIRTAQKLQSITHRREHFPMLLPLFRELSTTVNHHV